MMMARRLLSVLMLACACAHGAVLKVAVDTGTEMPLAQITYGKLERGIHLDLGLALGQVLGREVRFEVLPRKRIADAVERGDADLICLYVPAWLPGHFDWSQPFFPMSDVVVTDQRVPRPPKLAALAGKRLGTVLGYHYPELEQALGAGFVREDGPSAEHNLRKLAAGRLDHVVVSDIYFAYRQRLGDPSMHVYAPLLVNTLKLQCAVSRHGAVTVQDVNRAIDRITRDGTLQRILGHVKRP